MKLFKKAIPRSFEKMNQFLWKYPALFSFAVIFVLLSTQLAFIRSFYMTPDDIFKILTVKGIAANSTPSPFVGYSNILLGYLLMGLYALSPTFSWYGWFLCAVQFLTFWVFLWLLFSLTYRWFYFFIFVGLWISVFFIFFALFQFTMTSMLAAFAGLMVLLMSIESRGGKPQNGILPAASLLLLLSELIRPDAFSLAALVFAPFIFSRLFEKQFRHYAKNRWKLLTLTLLGILCLMGADFQWYQSDKNWDDYLRFDNARIELLNYRITDYTPETKPYFDSVGWSQNDYWLFKNWDLINSRKFNVSNINKLSAFFPRIGSKGKPYSCHSLSELLSWDWDLRIILCFCLLLICSSKSSWKFLLLQSLWVLLILIMLIYLFRAPDRINIPLLTSLILLSAFTVGNTMENQAKASSWAHLKMFMLLAAFVHSLSLPWNYYKQNEARRLSQEEMHAYFKMLKRQGDPLYIIWSFPFEEFGVFDDMESFKSLHLFVNSFSQTSPSSLNGLEHFWIREPLRDAVDNPNVFVICSAEEGAHYHQYMKETYQKEIYALPIFRSKHFDVFSIRSLKKR